MGVLDWLFDEGSLTRRLTRLSDGHFSVTPLFEGWQPLRADECAALDLAEGSEGWVREVYLRGHDQPWVFARSVAARSALQGDGLQMDELGSRSLGELLFCDQAFQRRAIEVCHYPDAGLPEEVRASGLWGRRSRFDRGALSVLVAEIFPAAPVDRRPCLFGELLMYVQLLKSLNRLNPRAWDFVQLTRMDKPIGIYLLLWPTLWALWIAGEGSPSIANVVIFVLGVVLTRAGGCVINDWADRKVDGHVKRTEQRPLVSGKISSKEALVFFAVLMSVSFLLVLCTNTPTILLSLGGLALAFSYPFMKRYTYYPQVVLGAAFSWGMPMAFTAETGHLPAAAWLLYIANLLWTVGYDTYYAMTDRDDDLRIGVKSTAILFGDADRVIILSLQGLALGCLLLAGAKFQLGGWFHLGLVAAAACFAWEFWYTRDRDRMRCFKAFLHNHWAGLAIFLWGSCWITL
nr:hypothetical protein GCM10020185_31050 [Pseudomonas brassicacearum subsp. brassicacearum]